MWGAELMQVALENRFGDSDTRAVVVPDRSFLTRDGMPPAKLREVAWAQMAAYPSVQRHDGSVRSLTYEDERWHAVLEDGGRLSAPAALVATGVVDEHPSIPGYQERWGHAIHHCPYCHGWEMQDLPLAVLGSDPNALRHLAPLLRTWSEDVVVLTGGAPLATETRAELEAQGIPVYTAGIEGLEGPGRELREIRLADGTTLDRQGLFVIAAQHQVPLVEALSLDLSDDGYVVVDEVGATSLPMLWAAGDLTSRMQQVVMASSEGARAGAMMHHALLAVR